MNFIPKGSGTASNADRFISRQATNRLTSLALKLLGIPERSSLSSILSGGSSWCLHGNSTTLVVLLEQSRTWGRGATPNNCGGVGRLSTWFCSSNNREATRLLPTECSGNDDDARRKVNMPFKMISSSVEVSHSQPTLPLCDVVLMKASRYRPEVLRKESGSETGRSQQWIVLGRGQLGKGIVDRRVCCAVVSFLLLPASRRGGCGCRAVEPARAS